MENEAETTELNMSTAFFLSCWIDDDDNDAKAQRKFTNFFSSLVCVAGHSFSFCSFFRLVRLFVMLKMLVQHFST